MPVNYDRIPETGLGKNPDHPDFLGSDISLQRCRYSYSEGKACASQETSWLVARYQNQDK
jgi:hypothetical protein